MIRSWIIVILYLFTSISHTYSQTTITGNNWNTNKDSIDVKIDSILRSHYQNHKNHAVWTDFDKRSPEGTYGYYVYDSLLKEIHQAVVYTFEGNVKTLTNYYFFQGNLIKVHQDNVPLHDQRSNKLNNLDRVIYYWNNTIERVLKAGKYKFDYRKDLEKAEDIIRRFNALQISRKL